MGNNVYTQSISRCIRPIKAYAQNIRQELLDEKMRRLLIKLPYHVILEILSYTTMLTKHYCDDKFDEFVFWGRFSKYKQRKFMMVFRSVVVSSHEGTLPIIDFKNVTHIWMVDPSLIQNYALNGNKLTDIGFNAYSKGIFDRMMINCNSLKTSLDVNTKKSQLITPNLKTLVIAGVGQNSINFLNNSTLPKLQNL